MTEFLANLLAQTGAILLPAITPVLALLVAALVIRLFKLAGVKISAAQAERVSATVIDAIATAEEAARTARTPMASTAKLQLARSIVLDSHPALGVYGAENAIHAKLPLVRAQLQPPAPQLIPPTPQETIR